MPYDQYFKIIRFQISRAYKSGSGKSFDPMQAFLILIENYYRYELSNKPNLIKWYMEFCD
tara:strand:- start:1378 stop:1557 length:180 start_codon:yes stop_codon:yes gene_type:complete